MRPKKVNSFSSQFRIKKGIDFFRIKDSASKAVSGSFTLLHIANDLEHLRLGIIVSKKVSKKACERNRLKRIIREAFRSNKETIPAKDYVVIARAKCCDADHKLLKDNLLNLIAREVS